MQCQITKDMIRLKRIWFHFSVFVVSKKFEESAEQTEEWYGTKYSVNKIPSDIVKVIQTRDRV